MNDVKKLNVFGVEYDLPEGGGGEIADGSITPEKTSFIHSLATNSVKRVPNFTNLADPTSTEWLTGKGESNSGFYEDSRIVATNLIPCVKGQVLRFKGFRGGGGTASTTIRIQPYNSTKEPITSGLYAEKTTAQTANGIIDHVTVSQDGVYEYTAFEHKTSHHSMASQFAYVRISGIPVTTVEDIIVTVNEEITYTEQEPSAGGYLLDETIVVPQATMNADEIQKIKKGLQSGARWFALGDSITQGYISYPDASASSGYGSKIDKEKCWVTHVANMNGYELTNRGVGGTGYLQGTTNARVLVDTIDFTECDFVTLAYGVNDWKYAVNIGTIDDLPQTEIIRNSAKSSFTTTKDTASGIAVYRNGIPLVEGADYTVSGTTVTLSGGSAPVGTVFEVYNATQTMVSNMAYTIKKILRNNPLCKIFVITPINCRTVGYYDTNWGIGYSGDATNNLGLEDIFELQKAVCETYGIELIDMTHCSSVNRENIRTMLADFVHPTEDAHRLMARELSKKILFK